MTRNRIINISFNPFECWIRADFRNFIKLLQETGNISLYIIALDENSENTAYINAVASDLEIATARTLVNTTTTDFLADIADNVIHIHFDTNNSVLTDVAAVSGTLCNPILVSYANNYTIDPVYINNFNRILEDLLDA